MAHSSYIVSIQLHFKGAYDIFKSSHTNNQEKEATFNSRYGACKNVKRDNKKRQNLD